MVNELNRRTKYYHLYGAEHELRLWASKHRNVYLVCIFACCREPYNKLRHSGCYGGSQQEALLAYEEDLKQEIAQDLIQSEEIKLLKRANVDLEQRLKKYEEAELTTVVEIDNEIGEEIIEKEQ